MQNISFLLSTKNSARTIKRAIQSILSVAITGDEILVCDDSEDNTLEVIASFNSSVIKVIKGNGFGIYASRLTLLARAECPFLFFVDGDDYIVDSGFSSARQRLNGSIDMLVFDCYKAPYDGGPLNVYASLPNTPHGEIAPKSFVLRFLEDQNCNPLWCKILRRTCLNANIPSILVSGLRGGEDRDLLVRSLDNFKSIYYLTATDAPGELTGHLNHLGRRRRGKMLEALVSPAHVGQFDGTTAGRRLGKNVGNIPVAVVFRQPAIGAAILRTIGGQQIFPPSIGNAVDLALLDEETDHLDRLGFQRALAAQRQARQILFIAITERFREQFVVLVRGIDHRAATGAAHGENFLRARLHRGAATRATEDLSRHRMRRESACPARKIVHFQRGESRPASPMKSSGGVSE
jgi:hypothetical protein